MLKCCGVPATHSTLTAPLLFAFFNTPNNHPSLAYAMERAQGRSPGAKDPTLPPVPIVKHADVRRMLLAQKAYCEVHKQLDGYAGAVGGTRHN